MNWEEAQIKERRWHDKHPLSQDEARRYYTWYFMFLDIEKNLWGKRIIEIGPADYPALMFCNNFKGFVIEPLPSKILELNCSVSGLTLIREKAENVEFPSVDEVWLFNVLQHTEKPDTIIRKSLKAGTVRFFEPINFGVDSMHLHNFTKEYFQQFFKNVKVYPSNPDMVMFHKHECA